MKKTTIILTLSAFVFLVGVGSFALAQSGTTSSSGFGNPIGPTTIEGVLGNIMSYLQGIAGAIAVIFIIIGGIMYMVSGGSKEGTERAKKTLIFAIVGLAIVLAAPLFYQEIKAVLSGGSPGSALKDILLRVLQLLLSIVGFLAIISMVIGAIWMFTAVGDEERYELGKKMAGYSILGLVIALSSLIIANQVTTLVGG
jgi:type IV secretory pathway VirB2 component (pilin)